MNTTLSIAPMSSVIRALNDRTCSSVDLVTTALSRIQQYDSGDHGIHAILAVAHDALEQAALSDARRACGRPLSVWDGIPVLVKDCIETANMPTTLGSTVFRGWHPHRDAEIVRRMRAAGAIMLGKTSLDDFAASCFGISSLGGIMHNPHDRSRSVGGSSGGSAASVAAGYVPFAIGTDTGGSLRIPAALCGVATMRPTISDLPIDGCFPRSPRQDVIGPLANNVAGLVDAYALMKQDCTIAQQVITTYESYDSSVDSSHTLRPLCFGLIEHGLAIFGDEPEGIAVQAIRKVATVLTQMGHTVIPLSAPDADLLGAGSAITVDSEDAVNRFLQDRPSAPVHSLRELATCDGISEGAQISFARELSADRSSEHLAQIERGRIALRAWWNEQHRNFDFLLYPAVQSVAVLAGLEQSGVFTRLSEHTGNPAICIPCWPPHQPIATSGITYDNDPAIAYTKSDSSSQLPVSIEIMGSPGREIPLLATALVIEQAIEIAGLQRCD